MNRITQLLERIGALQRSELRRFAQEKGLQMVHLEVLGYLQNCNRYSDTTQALSEYLGQTKGSISQTLGYLEEEGYLKRTQDQDDKRVFHLSPLASGRKLVQEFESRFFGEIDISVLSEKSLEEALSRLQKKSGARSFGICSTCRYNTNPTGQQFVCGLTGEKLSVDDTKLRCREHEEKAAG